MVRTLIRNAALVAVIGLMGSHAHAGFVGSFGVNANSPVLMPVNSLASATSFTIASFSSNGNTSGGFSGIGLVAETPFSGGTIILGNSTSLTFSNATFGTFTETAAPILNSTGMNNGVVDSESYLILGTYIGGPVGTPAVPASFTISFTQDGGPGSSVSASGTLTIPPSVPEPASAAMLGIGLVTLVGYGLRRQFAK